MAPTHDEAILHEMVRATMRATMARTRAREAARDPAAGSMFGARPAGTMFGAQPGGTMFGAEAAFAPANADPRVPEGDRLAADVVGAGAGSDLTRDLERQIEAGRITFDVPKFEDELLGRNAGTRVTRTLQSLVLTLSELVPKIRIGSLIRGSGQHGAGRAVDLGNEEIAGALLPRVATPAQVSALRIDELIFDAAVAGQADRNLWNYDQGRPHDYDNATLNGHKTNIHFSVTD